LFDEVIQPGATWSHILKRGTSLRITDTQGGGNAGSIFYNADNPAERYNMPDTLKAQHTAHLTRGHVLYSDMGRILCSITADTVGWMTLSVEVQTKRRWPRSMVKPDIRRTEMRATGTHTMGSSSNWRNTASAPVIWPRP
jgi:hypothetical protein